ncbi:tRNA lysidine(34) synthetase TilS [Pseudoflavonifractor sp. CLA-AP-H29]|uniref:tRNA(Ile)-lysidine synthase n=1 Tax=Pseudoflavonifractor intestinihominis TaxID=3133171 RepID=A0ABV1EBU4_9FIRM
MTDALNTLATEYDMLPRGGTVLCAVSGGADSVYLLHRLWLLRDILGFNLIAAHYNHCLRGAESERDEAFVRDFVAKWCGPQRFDGPHGAHTLPAVELVVGRGDVAGEAARQGRGLEETARDMRYAFLRDTARRLGCDRIATAHTADDNAETLLLHLIRGTGLQGLAGIAPRRGDLVRPMLTTTRREVEEYLALYSIPHVEDSSNSDERFTRNRIRRQVVPLLEELNPGFVRRMADTTRYLRSDNDFLNAQAAQVCAHARWAEDDLVIEARYLADAPAAIAPRAARRLLEMMGDGDTDCSAAHLEAIVDLCRGDDPSAVAFLPGGRLAQRVYGELLLTTRDDPRPPFEPVTPVRGENPIPGTDWKLVLEEDPWPGLVIRPRRQGDELTRPGRKSRTVKKLMIDEKIPRRDRERVPVAADGDGVIAVAGLGGNARHPRFGAALRFIRRERTDTTTETERMEG